jgi:hypothetical protein
LSDEIIICFEGTSEAIMAEQALLERALEVRVMPKPSDIKAGCGFCLRFSPELLKKVAELLTELGIKGTESYRMRREDNGVVSYSRV